MIVGGLAAMAGSRKHCTPSPFGFRASASPNPTGRQVDGRRTGITAVDRGFDDAVLADVVGDRHVRPRGLGDVVGAASLVVVVASLVVSFGVVGSVLVSDPQPAKPRPSVTARLRSRRPSLTFSLGLPSIGICAVAYGRRTRDAGQIATQGGGSRTRPRLPRRVRRLGKRVGDGFAVGRVECAHSCLCNQNYLQSQPPRWWGGPFGFAWTGGKSPVVLLVRCGVGVAKNRQMRTAGTLSTWAVQRGGP